MEFHISNNLLGILNFLTFLLSIPILAGGIWLKVHSSEATECSKSYPGPLIAIGVFLLLVSLAGLIGACCRVTWLLWIYLVVMFILILLLICITIFAFVVTNKGAGKVVSGSGYKEYRLGDYSSWLQNRVNSTKNWSKYRVCLVESEVCQSLENKTETFDQFYKEKLSPVQSGCCKPPSECGFTYVSPINWTKNSTVTSANPDCTAWSNTNTTLCYDCQSCKAGEVATLQAKWKGISILNIIFLIFIAIVYSLGCCAFRNNRRDNQANAGGKASMQREI